MSSSTKRVFENDEFQHFSPERFVRSNGVVYFRYLHRTKYTSENIINNPE